MKFNEVLEQFEAINPEELLQALQKIEQISSEAGAESQQASRAYFADVAEQEARITARVAELSGRRNKPLQTLEVHKRKLREATARGNEKGVETAKEALKTLQAEVDALSSEINILEAAPLVGDTALYDDVVAKNNRFLELKNEYRRAKRLVYDLANEKIEAFEELKGETNYYDLGGGFGANMEKLEEHFHAEKLSKMRSQHEKEQAALREAEVRNSCRQVFAPIEVTHY